jgi:hypothetical protein
MAYDELICSYRRLQQQFVLVVLIFLFMFSVYHPYSIINYCSRSEAKDQSLLVQNAIRVLFILWLISIHFMVDPVYLTLSLLMSYKYGAPSKARNLTSYIYILYG